MRKIDFGRMLTREVQLEQDRRLALAAALIAAETELTASDWQVIRGAEGGTAMAPELREARTATRARSSRLRDDLAALPQPPQPGEI